MALQDRPSPGEWLGEHTRERLSGVLAAALLISAAVGGALRRRVLPAVAVAGRAVARSAGWWVELLSRAVPGVGRRCADGLAWCADHLAGGVSEAARGGSAGMERILERVARIAAVGVRRLAAGVGRYVDWWARAAVRGGGRLVDATGWVLDRGSAGARAVTGRLVPSFAGFMAVAAAAVTWIVVVVAATVPAASGYGDIVEVGFDIPEDTALPTLAERSVVYASDGSVLAVLHDEQDRRLVALESLPEHIWQAAIAAEDRRFFEHEGYDVEAIGRAAVANVRARGVAQGGSTITQQLAKQNFLTDEQTLERKARELTYAMALEDRLTKEELLQRYLNQVYFGGGSYGIAAAAEEWFGAPPDQISLEQAALLAGMIRAPGRLDPRDNPEAATARRNAVLRGMAAEGYISPERLEVALEVPMGVLPRRQRSVSEPFFVEAVKKEFFKNPAFGETRQARIDRLFNGGLAIHTTIDPRVQDAAHDMVERHYPAGASERTAAIAAVDPRTGRIVAAHSGVDFEAEAYDLATQGRRHPGSAAKLFVLATALERGRSIDSTVSGAGPREFVWDPHQEPYRVRNFANQSFGTLSLREALVKSVNTAFVELILDTGMSYVVEKAGHLGVEVNEAFGPVSARGPAIAIGGMYQGVTPLEMASAAGTFATQGQRAEPFLINHVADANGQEIYRHEPAREQAVSPQTAATMLDAMQNVVARGTGTRAQLPGWPVAGKTGTAQNFADAWFVGTTAVLSTAVWVGHPDGRVPYPGMTGGQFAAPVWRDFMTFALEGVPPQPFPPGPQPAPPLPPPE